MIQITETGRFCSVMKGGFFWSEFNVSNKQHEEQP